MRRVNSRVLAAAVIAAAWWTTVPAQGRPGCSSDHGACFVELEGQELMFSHIDGAVGATAYVFTGDRGDFRRIDGPFRGRAHMTDHQAQVVVCPNTPLRSGSSCLAEFRQTGIPPEDSLVGTGRISMSITFDPDSLICPTSITGNATAIGPAGETVRVNDWFILSGALRSAGCRIVMNEITITTVPQDRTEALPHGGPRGRSHSSP